MKEFTEFIKQDFDVVKDYKKMFEFYDESEFEEFYFAEEKYCLIVFKKLMKEYYKVDNNGRRRAINSNEHKFITKKLIEFGWLDD